MLLSGSPLGRTKLGDFFSCQPVRLVVVGEVLATERDQEYRLEWVKMKMSKKYRWLWVSAYLGNVRFGNHACGVCGASSPIRSLQLGRQHIVTQNGLR